MNRKWLWGLIGLVVLLLAAAPVGLEPYPYIMHIAIVAFFYAILFFHSILLLQVQL